MWQPPVVLGAWFLSSGVMAALFADPVLRIRPDSGGRWVSEFRKAAASLQKNPGGRIQFDSGEFRLGTSDTLLLHDVRDAVISGTGATTRLVSARKETPPLYIIKLLNCTNVQFRGLTLNGAPLPVKWHRQNPEWHTGVFVLNGEGIQIRDCRFTGFYTGGVHFNGTLNASVSHCRFDSVDNKAGGDYGAIHLQELDGAVVADNEILNCRFSGISSWSAKRLLVQRNNITIIPGATYGMGLYMIGGLEHSVLAENRIERPANEGIMIHGKKGQPVIGNVVSKNAITAAYAGIVFNDATTDVGETRANVVLDNSISGTPSDPVDLGILLHQNRLTTVSGNNIRLCISGISLQNSARENTLSRNTIVRCKAGIAAGGETLIEDNRIDSASEFAVIVSHTSRTLIRRNTIGATPKALIRSDNILPGALILEGNTGMEKGDQH